MRLILRDREIVAVRVPLPAQEAVDVAGGHAGRPQEHDHRRGEVLAMPRPALEQEMIERGLARRGRQLRRIRELARQPGLDGPGAIPRVVRTSRQ